MSDLAVNGNIVRIEQHNAPRLPVTWNGCVVLENAIAEDVLESRKAGAMGVPVAGSPLILAAPRVLPSQGTLLHQTLVNLFNAIPPTGQRDATAREIGEALQLSPEDLARFVPLVRSASISSAADGGTIELALTEAFRFTPHPEGRELIIKQILRGNVSRGKLEVSEGLAAVINALVSTNIKRIEDATEGGRPGVRVVAQLGTDFFPI